MARALLPPSFVRRSPEQSKRGAGDRDRTLSRSCPTQKSKNFVSRARSRSAPLRFAAPSAWVQKGGWAGLRAASASSVTLCWRGATRRLGLCVRHSDDTAHQHTQQDGRAAPATDLREKQEHRNSLREPVAAPWAGFWTGLSHDAGAATVPTEPPPGGVNLGRVLTDGRVQRFTFLSANGPSDAPRLLTLYRPLHWPQPATINPWITARNREPPASGFAILQSPSSPYFWSGGCSASTFCRICSRPALD